ncbi:Carnitine O-palmitoyltransferase 1, liver isoform isoform X2 [Oopsacas minuta]|uniref:Carnitine O-palmitoyltransferase 1, liver isoform isoform X2 n=1 Tax=Oopsacas minuta TaxID=111878 RepID=A0AAV7JPJ3_9METZ|nr:Carnitine O-palmitoyltransferase 1, liver isoform isoform X2 [Oopsacas minuta]
MLPHFTNGRHKQILFSDEKLFTVQQVLNKQNHRILATDKSTLPESTFRVSRTQKPASVMVWAGVTATGRTPLIFIPKGVKINQSVYRESILENVLKPWAQSHFGNDLWVFQQDSAPADKAKATQKWCKTNFPGVISSEEWPPCSPDLNLLDFSIWSILEERVNATLHRSVEVLKSTLLREWSKIPDDKEEYAKHEELAREFLQGQGLELQKELVKRHKSTENYLSEYWENFVYLAAGRRSLTPNDDTSPNPGIMINLSVALFCPFLTPQNFRQASRAASISHLHMFYRDKLQNGDFPPLCVPGTNVPLCSEQYRRVYNLNRCPCKGPIDRLEFYPGRENGYVVVYNQGRYYKVDCYQNGKLVSPKQLEKTFLTILADKSPVSESEERLPSFTAGDRGVWAEFRENYLSSGQNKENMRFIDECAFVVVLDPEERYIGKLPQFILGSEKNPYYPQTDTDHISTYAASVLHGNGYNLWMDKSINFIVFKTGLYGMTIEHTTSEAPPYVQFTECVTATDMDYFVGTNFPVPLWVDKKLVNRVKKRYNEQGYINDDSDPNPAVFTKLEWEINDEMKDKILIQAALTSSYIKSLQLKLGIFDKFGKIRVKQLKLSPDAFIQMALQLAYYKDQKEFTLTYESALTRLFKHGRTDTIRSVTEDSCQFVLAMMDDVIDSYEVYKLLSKAGHTHNLSMKKAMVGQGIDRHLLALYITSKLKGENSEFLTRAMSIPFKLSSSQVPSQIGLDYKARPDTSAMGGGFGPVTKHGYGVAYFFQADVGLTFHLSAFNESGRTNVDRFYDYISESLIQMEAVCDSALQLSVDERGTGKSRLLSFRDSMSFSEN